MLRVHHIHRIDLRPLPYKQVAPPGVLSKDLPSEVHKASESVTETPRYLVLDAKNNIMPVGRTSKSVIRERLSKEDNAFFESAVISRRHAQFVLENDNVYLQDCGSMHGTTVDGVSLTEADDKKVQVKNGSEVVFGTPVFRDNDHPKMHFPLAFKCDIRKEDAIPEPPKKVEAAPATAVDVDAATDAANARNGYGLSTADLATSDAEDMDFFKDSDDEDDVQIVSSTRKEKKVMSKNTYTITIDDDVLPTSEQKKPVSSDSQSVHPQTNKTTEEKPTETSDDEENDVTANFDKNDEVEAAVPKEDMKESFEDEVADEDYYDDEDHESSSEHSEEVDDHYYDEEEAPSPEYHDYYDSEEEIYAGDDEVMEDDTSASEKPHEKVPTLDALISDSKCVQTSDFFNTITKESVRAAQYDFAFRKRHLADGYRTLPQAVISDVKNTPSMGTFQTGHYTCARSIFAPSPPQLPTPSRVPVTKPISTGTRLSISDLLGEVAQMRRNVEESRVNSLAETATTTRKHFENSINSLLSPVPALIEKLAPPTKRKYDLFYEEDGEDEKIVDMLKQPVEEKKDTEMADVAIQTTSTAVEMVDAQTEVSTETTESATETMEMENLVISPVEQNETVSVESKEVVKKTEQPKKKKAKRSHNDKDGGSGYAKFASGALAGVVIGSIGMFAALVATAPV